MTTPIFDELYQKLNPAQKEAVDNIEGPVMVIAGPGTGKTQILTIRIANILLKTQVNAQNILALTFTESGVLAMRKRLVSMIGTEGYRATIGTFHSFCNDIIQGNPEDFPNLISAQSITEVEQLQILENIFLENQFNIIKPLGDPFYYLKLTLSSINDLKKEGIGVKVFEEGIKEQEKDYSNIADMHHEKGPYKGQVKGKYLDLKREIDKNLELIKVYDLYQKALHKLKKYDFSDMLIEVISALEKNPDLLMRLQERYQYILVDEHQDTNTAQNKLIELLSGFYENPNLFVVGDEKQAIYRFQGATLENFLYFQKLYPKAKLVNLEENYRSSQTILNAAASLIKQNITSEILYKNLNLKSNVKYPEEPVKIAGFLDYYAEIYFIIQDIQEKISQGVSPKELVILSRNNRDLTPYVEALEQMGVPYIVESDQNIFADPDIRKLVLLFEAICNFGSDLELILAMHIDFLGIDQLDLYKILAESRSRNISVYQLMSTDSLIEDLNLKSKEKILDFYQKLETWRSLYDNENLPGVFLKILNESGLLKTILTKKNYQDILERIEGLFEEARNQWEKNNRFTLSDLLSYLKLLEEHDILIKKKVSLFQKDAVRLMTAHKSKGLEFDFVYITNCFDSHWGNLKRKSKGFRIPWEILGVKLKLDVEIEEDEDERRLFYVAITRARRGVTISYSTQSQDGREQIPSQFISEIDDKFKTYIDASLFERNFSGKKEVIFAPPVVALEQKYSKDFFTKLFKERGLSVTGLNNYLDCPWKFFYNNLLDLPEPQVKSATFGSAVHQAISRFIKNSNAHRNADTLVDYFKESLRRQISDSSVSFAELSLKGDEVLRGFYEKEMVNWSKKLFSEVKIDEVEVDGININGKIDLVEIISGRNVRIYDFKTGDPQSRNQILGNTKSSKGNYFRQLVFYKLLIDFDKRWEFKDGVIQFVEPDKKGEFKKEVFEVSKEDTDELIDLIKQVSKEITNLEFWNKKCDNKDCEYCNLRSLMI